MTSSRIQCIELLLFLFMAIQQKSVKTNYILSLINTIIGVLFPLITLPYITRVITPEGIGQVQFYTTVIDYIILITSLGIPLFAVREIAKYRDDIEKRNQITVDLLLMHTCFTIGAYVIVLIFSLSIPKIQENLPLFFLLSVGILLNTIGVQWFFQAIEDFVYITIRSVIVKVICLVMLFVFVRTKEDLIAYGFIQLLGIGGNYIFNFIRLNNLIQEWRKYIRNWSMRSYIIPVLRVFLLNVTVGIYTQMSFLLLGFFSGNEAVGFFSMPYRMVSVSLSIITALGAVLLPRFSNYVGANKRDEFNNLGNKSISLILALVFPMTTGLLILAEPITLLICGEAFYPSIIVLRLLVPQVIIIGISQVYGKYMLYSMGKEILMVICTCIGLFIYLVIGVPLIIEFSEIGAAVAVLCAEISVTLSMIILGRRYIKATMFRRTNLNYVFGTIVMSVFVSFALFIHSYLISVVVGVILGIFVYSIYLILNKDPFYLEILEVIKRRLNRT